MVEQQTEPVVFTLDAFTAFAQRDRWLYIEVDKSSTDPQQVTVDVPEEAVRFPEESLQVAHVRDDAVRHHAVERAGGKFHPDSVAETRLEIRGRGVHLLGQVRPDRDHVAIDLGRDDAPRAVDRYEQRLEAESRAQIEDVLPVALDAEPSRAARADVAGGPVAGETFVNRNAAVRDRAVAVGIAAEPAAGGGEGIDGGHDGSW